jgi:glutamate-1-semialdehyde 2,1-aminomutase
MEKSSVLFNRAKKSIPGGVNSPVRAFKAVGGNPLFIKKAKGAYVYDEDDNEYIELINSWGPMILGHAFPPVVEAVKKASESSLSFGAPNEKEVEIAELICSMVPSIEKVRMVNSGTEATMSAIRVARGFTGKDKIVKVEGCYHGHADSFLIAAGSGAVTMGSPDSPGVTAGTAKDTLLIPYNNVEALREVVSSHKGEIAALIIEPVPGNMGCLHPKDGYLETIRQICNEESIVLIFDEVMTGFRLARGGAQEMYGVTPDMTTLGKIIGGGMPVGAYGGKTEIMDFVSPDGPVYQAGTLSGNPVAMAAGLAILNHLKDHPEIYASIENKTRRVAEGIRSNLEKLHLPYQVINIGSMLTLFFTEREVDDFESVKACDLDRFAAYFKKMLQLGIYLAPSQYESLFLSDALSEQDIDRIIESNYKALIN